MLVDVGFGGKPVVAVEAGAKQNLKRPTKRVLVNARCPIKPVIGIDMKSRAGVNSNGWVAEFSSKVLLAWDLSSGEQPANDFPRRDVFVRRYFSERFGGNFRKQSLVVAMFFPALL